MITHFTTVHPRDDSRIRSKMMETLQERFQGHVTLLVQDGLEDEEVLCGFTIKDTGPQLRRVSRMSVGGWRMFRAVLQTRPKIAHFHDPELIPWAVLLRIFGIKMIYDVHEDYPEAVAHNYRLAPWARVLLPSIVFVVERIGCLFFSGIVAATPQIASRFPASKTVTVRNWPKIEEFHSPTDVPMRERAKEFVYIGTITLNRNIIGILDACEMARSAGVVLRLAGHFTVASDEVQANCHAGWEHVCFDGWVNRDDVADILSNARAGLVVLRPIKHEMLTLPIKLFEYMAAGIPVISSNFQLWREIIEETKCGLLVDPDKPEEIANAMRWVLENPDEAEAMGKRGHAAVLERFNWGKEAKSLIAVYETILGCRAGELETLETKKR